MSPIDFGSLKMLKYSQKVVLVRSPKKKLGEWRKMKKSGSFKILKRSPIVEATFQANFATKTPFSEKEAKAFVEAHFAGYGLGDHIFSESIAVKKKGAKDPPESITHQQSWTGTRFVNGNYVITVFADGFALGVLKPYPTDESFFGEIRKVADVFSVSFAEQPVTRIGLRFINRFPVDADHHAPGDTLMTLPASPRRLGYGEPVQFLYQDVFRNSETGIVVVVNRLFPANGSETPNASKILLDIDASVAPNRVVGKTQFSDAIDELRIAVNKTFFGSVSKSVVEELS